MSARLVHNLDDLTRDLERLPVKVARGGAEAVRDSAKQGAKIARALARRSSRKHGKYYPRTITDGRSEGSRDARSQQGGSYAWEYGTTSNWRFEFGSRNQPPHLDHAQSADIVGVHGTYGARIERLLDGLFW